MSWEQCRTGRTRRAALVALTGLVLAAGCSGPDPRAPSTTTPPKTSATAAPSVSASPSATTGSSAAPEPTTTNTLPPPPRPTRPAPRTAGPLSAASLPVPAGWRTVEPPGNGELGQPGNGSWVQSTDPRYAAQGAIGIGCATVTRDDYPDPTAALTGGYRSRAGDPGVGLALQFGSPADASVYWTAYVRGVRACERGAEGISTAGVREPEVDQGRGLVDRRTDETQDPTDWTEVGALRGDRVVLVNLGDPGHAVTDEAADRLLNRIPAP